MCLSLKNFFSSQDDVFYPESDIMRDSAVTTESSLFFLMDGGITFCPPIRKTTEGYTVPRTKKKDLFGERSFHV